MALSILMTGLGPWLTLAAVTVYLSVRVHGGKLDTSLGATLMLLLNGANSLWPGIMTLKHVEEMRHYLLNLV